MIGPIRRSDEAQALVEFALIIPVFLLLVLGFVDTSRAVFQYITLADAAREGTRYAIVHGGASSSPSGPAANDAGVQAQVLRYTIGVPSVTVASTWPDGTNGRGSHVSVIVTAPFVPIASQLLLSGALAVTVRGGSEQVIER
ncbi:MAG: pilus assembly protein [Chloroflexota bacterium]|nr:pilus assembly protein [Chloroflexota bacterium]